MINDVSEYSGHFPLEHPVRHPVRSHAIACEIVSLMVAFPMELTIE